jgi:WD40 repeat protein
MVFVLCASSFTYAQPLNYTKAVKVLKKNGEKIVYASSLSTGNLIVVDNSGKITYYSVNNFKELSSEKVDGGKVLAVAVSQQGKYILFYSADNILRLISLPDLKAISKIQIQHNGIPILRFTGGGSHVVLAFKNGDMFFYSIPILKLQDTIKGNGIPLTAIAFPEGDVLHFATGYANGKIDIWSTISDMTIYSINTNSGSIALLRYSPKGEFLLSLGSDNTIKFWDAQKGVRLEINRKDSEGNIKKVKMECELSSNPDFFSFSSDNSYVMLGGKDGTVSFMKIANCEKTDVFNLNVSDVNSMTLFDNDRYVLVGTNGGNISVFRNPFLVNAYNFLVNKGDEAMSQKAYEGAIFLYSKAIGFYSEKETEQKLKQAKEKWEENRAEQYKEMQKLREQYKNQ